MVAADTESLAAIIDEIYGKLRDWMVRARCWRPTSAAQPAADIALRGR